MSRLLKISTIIKEQIGCEAHKVENSIDLEE